jgi:hypothetical protein
MAYSLEEYTKYNIDSIRLLNLPTHLDLSCTHLLRKQVLV